MQGHLKINVNLLSVLCPPQLHKNHSTFATHVKKKNIFKSANTANKSKKISPSFPKCAQLGEGSAIRSALY